MGLDLSIHAFGHDGRSGWTRITAIGRSGDRLMLGKEWRGDADGRQGRDRNVKGECSGVTNRPVDERLGEAGKCKTASECGMPTRNDTARPLNSPATGE